MREFSYPNPSREPAAPVLDKNFRLHEAAPTSLRQGRFVKYQPILDLSIFTLLSQI